MRKIIEFYKKYRNDIFKPVIVLLCICIVIPLALAVTNRVTEERIKKLSIQKRNTAMSRLVKADEFKEDTFKFKGEDITYYTALKSGEITAFVFINKENGYGGAVEVMTVLSDGGTIKAVDILDVSNETPGLGQNTAKEGFYSQFSGKTDEVTVVKNNANGENNEINAVTGATISSSAVTRAVNASIKQYKALALKLALGGAE